jgi:hypothetical protein
VALNEKHFMPERKAGTEDPIKKGKAPYTLSVKLRDFAV